MRAPYLNDGDVRVYAGDCIEVIHEMPADSVDAIVTDPPYGLRFMGKAWDGADIERMVNVRQRAWERREIRGGGETSTAIGSPAAEAGTYDLSLTGNRAFQAWCETWAREALRVLKPGGHLLAAGSSRTFHRLVCAVEDAGFEIRDTITHHYGSGFPKSLAVDKAIDREAGAERGVVGARPTHYPDSDTWGLPNQSPAAKVGTVAFGDYANVAADGARPITAPATPEAAAWQGWGTALKPATEFWTVARKPLAERTVARQVLATGTGALNVDGCRVGRVEGDRTEYGLDNGAPAGIGYHGLEGRTPYDGSAGRWPPNCVWTHDAACEDDGACALGCPVGELDRQTADLHSAGYAQGPQEKWMRESYDGVTGWGAGKPCGARIGDAGGASRFFPTFKYEAKAATLERDGTGHPTTKPVALMRWLVKLVTPPGGLVLDPFAGSGTTLLAARNEGLRAIGIEREPEYLAMCAHRLRQLSLFAGTG